MNNNNYEVRKISEEDLKGFDNAVSKSVEDLMKKYVDELLEACLNFDIKEFKAFAEKWKGIYPACFQLPEDDVLEIVLRKIVINRSDAPKDKRKEAACWLIDNGYDLSLE